MNVAELAKLLGVTAAEAGEFLACLAVWTRKGLTIEQAIEAHLNTLSGLLNKVADAMSNEYSLHAAGVNALTRSLSDQVWESR